MSFSFAVFGTKSRSLLYSAAGQIAVALSSLLSIRIYTELLSQSEFGFAMIIMSGVALLDSLIVMALNQTLLSVCARIDEAERQRQIAVGLGFRLFAALGVALGPIALLVIALAAPLGLDSFVAVAPTLALVYLGEEITKSTMLSPLIARRDYFRTSIWMATESTVTLAITSVALILFRADAGGFLAGLLCSRMVCTAAFFFVFFGGRYFSRLDLSLAAPFVGQALQYGAPVSAMGPIGWFGAYLDRYAIAFSAGLGGAGIYSAVAGVVGRPYMILTSILTNYFRPMLFKQREEAARQWLTASIGVGLLGALAFASLGGLASGLFLAPEYRQGATAMMTTLALAQTLVVMTHAVDNDVLAAGASAKLLRMQVWLFGPALLLVPLWAFWYGALGAAVGRLMTEAVKFGATLILARRLARAATATEGAAQ